MKKNLFIKNLAEYFGTFLPDIRNCSSKTIQSYKDSFIILFEYFETCHKKNSYNIDYDDFSIKNMENYIFFLKNERNYSDSSIRVRIAAISSFLKYASRREIKAIGALNSVGSIVLPTVKNKEKSYFTKEEIAILLRVPDINYAHGYRDRVILSLLYDSGARAQEICDLNINDIKFSKPAKVRILGKGKKYREVPISNDVSKLLANYIKILELPLVDPKESPLFIGERGGRITPSLIKHLVSKTVKQAAEKNPDLFSYKNYSPHSFRHSKAIHMLEAGVPIIYIRNFLGHSSVQTTEIYAKITQANFNKVMSEKSPHVSIPNDVKKETDNNIPIFLKKMS